MIVLVNINTLPQRETETKHNYCDSEEIMEIIVVQVIFRQTRSSSTIFYVAIETNTTKKTG